MGLQLLENNVHGRVYLCLIVSYKLIEITNFERGITILIGFTCVGIAQE